MSEVLEYLARLTDEELLNLLGGVMSNPQYKKNSYSDMVSDIASKFEKFKKFSAKQRAAICMHLSFTKELWF